MARSEADSVNILSGCKEKKIDITSFRRYAAEKGAMLFANRD